MKKIIVWFGLVLLFVALGTYGWKKYQAQKRWARNTAFLTFEGMVLDQYGLPVSGARIIAEFPYSRGYSWDGYDRGFRTEVDAVYTDKTGHYVFNSKPRRHSYAEVFTDYAFDSEGNFLQIASHLTFRYDPVTGWSNGAVMAHDLVQGWHFVDPQKGAPVILRVNRSDGIRRLAYGYHLMIDGNSKKSEVCLDADRSVMHSGSDGVCDVRFKITPCPGEEWSMAEITASEGGVILYDKNKMSEIEAPPGDYPQSLKIIEHHCPANYAPSIPRTSQSATPIIFFYSRNKQVYGRLLFRLNDWTCVKENKCKPGSIEVSLNPRGERTLVSGFGTPGDGLPQLKFPIEIPYHDPWMLDYSKIEVGEDKAKGEVFVRGLPGAAPNSKYMLIKNDAPDKGEDKRSINDRVNPDGSFEFRLKADLRGRIYLYATFEADEKSDIGPDAQIIPLTKLVKLTAEAKKKNGSSAH